MGEATTKPEFWLVALGFVIVLTFGLYAFGASIRYSEEVTLDSDSQTYLDKYYSNIKGAGITDKAEHQLTEEETKNPVRNALGAIRDFFDVFGIFTLLTTVLSGFWTFITMVFNLPSFFLETLGLPMDNFRFLTNVIAFVLSISATIMLVRLKK